MFIPEEKEFYATVAWGASNLSTCKQKHGAVIVGNATLFYGYNKTLTEIHEKSAIMMVIHRALAVEGNIDGCALFTTQFPNVADMKMIIEVGISYVYFFGNIDDPDTVRLINETGAVEMVQLEMAKGSQPSDL